MARSTRFPAAIHILTLLAIKKGQCCSSEWMAKSLGTNAVVVRRIVGMLQDAGIVTSQAGSQGGTKLAVEPETVNLKDIYDAVEDESVFCMHDPHPKCPVACSVKNQVNDLLGQAEQRMKAELAGTRLSSITRPAIAQYRKMSH